MPQPGPLNPTKTRIELAAATDMPRLNRIFRRAVRSHGFSTFAVGHIPDCAVEGGGGVRRDGASSAHRPFMLLDWPRAWLELYAREGFAADDVVIAEAGRVTEPFTWSDVQARYPGASARIFAAAAEFGWGEGFVIPLHDPAAPPGERLGVASLAAAHLTGFGAQRRGAVVALAQTAFARARMLAQTDDKPASGRHGAVGVQAVLNARERDALILVAEGRNDLEIGTVLGISRAGAHFHVESAKRRLGAATRAQAVAIALTRGLL